MGRGELGFSMLGLLLDVLVPTVQCMKNGTVMSRDKSGEPLCYCLLDERIDVKEGK